MSDYNDKDVKMSEEQDGRMIKKTMTKRPAERADTNGSVPDDISSSLDT